MWQQRKHSSSCRWLQWGGGMEVVGLLFCFTFGNASMLISIYFVLLPVNREARLRVAHPLARGWIGWLLVVLVWGATVQQCRAIEVGWLQSQSECVLKRTTLLTWQKYCLVFYGWCGRFLVVYFNCYILLYFEAYKRLAFWKQLVLSKQRQDCESVGWLTLVVGSLLCCCCCCCCCCCSCCQKYFLLDWGKYQGWDNSKEDIWLQKDKIKCQRTTNESTIKFE